MNDKLEKIWNDADLAILVYCITICLQELGNTTETSTKRDGSRIRDIPNMKEEG
jgi:hypothetical protein